jgi:hypothetical protein
MFSYSYTQLYDNMSSDLTKYSVCQESEDLATEWVCDKLFVSSLLDHEAPNVTHVQGWESNSITAIGI